MVSLALALMGTALGAAEREVGLSVRVFKIPREQNWDVEQAALAPGVSTCVCRGDATVVFPDGVVFLPTELAVKADESAIVGAIRDRVFFGNGVFRANKVMVEEIGKWETRFTPKSPTAQNRIEKEKSQSSWETYDLKAELRPVDGPDAFIKLRFDVGSHSYAGGLGVGLSSDLFSETVVIPESRQDKILLIGFPSHDKGSRGTVYWLAVSATGLSTSLAGVSVGTKK